MLVVLPAAINPAGAVVVEPLKTSLLRCLAASIAATWVASRLLAEHAAVDLGRLPLVRSGLVLAGAACLSTIVSLNPAASLFGTNVRGVGLLNTLAGAALLVTGADLFADTRRRGRAVAALLAGAVVPCAYALLQVLRLDPLDWTGVVGLVSTLGSPTFLGGYLVLVTPFALYRAATAGRDVLARSALRSSLRYVLALALLALCASVLLVAGIRGPLVGLVVAIATFAAALTRGSSAMRRAIAFALAALLLAAAAALVVSAGRGAPPPALARLADVTNPSGSARERLVVWWGALPLPLAEPLRTLVGFGPEMQAAAFERSPLIAYWSGNQRWDRAHGMLVDTWVTGGLLGLATLAVLVGVTLRTAWRAAGQAHDPDRRALAAALLAAVAGHLVEQSFAFESVATGALFWTVLALCASLGAQPSASPGSPRGPRFLGAGVALAASLLALPMLAAPAVADALHGASQRAERVGSYRAAAELAERGAAWAPWLEPLPRAAAINWQRLGFGGAGEAAQRNLRRAAADLEEATRRDPFDPYAHLRLARHDLEWARSAPPADVPRAALFDAAGSACDRALMAGPYLPAIWESCAEVSASRGAPAEAAERRARANSLRASRGSGTAG